MGRSLLIEKLHEDKLKEIGHGAEFQLGLILGQQSEGKDYATDFVCSPDPTDDSDDKDNGTVNDSKPAGSKKDTKQLFDISWIAEHGRQVNRMLIGGISVLGIYVYCSSEVVSANQSKLSQCLYSLHSRIERNKWLKKAYLHSDRYLLHICSTTRKLTCRSFDISNKQATSKPVDCKFQPFLANWHSTSTNIDVHVNISVPLSPKATETEKSILLACQYEIEQIWGAYCTSEDCKLLVEEQLIANSTTKTKSKSKHGVSGQSLKFTLFKLPNGKKIEDVVEQETTYLDVKFFGGIYSRAVLNSKATYGDAIKALKVDVIRSLLTRIELLCEEAEVNNLVQVEEWSLVSPMRVFCPVLKSSLLYFCDYSFKDESVDDIVSRFSEMLNLSVKNSELVYFERSPDVSEASMLFHSPEKPIDQQSDVVSELSNSLVDEGINSTNKHIYFLIAIIILLIGILIKIVLF